MDKIPTHEQLTEIQRVFSEARIKNWINIDFMSFNWWVLLIILIVPWIIWWKLVDKKRMVEILLYGLIASTLITYADAIGVELLLWTYPTKFIPILPSLVPLNFTLFTVLFMLIYQYTNNWKSYIVVQLISSVISAFICLPILNWMGIGKILKWNYFYSFLLLIGVALLSKLFINIFLNRQHQQERYSTK